MPLRRLNSDKLIANLLAFKPICRYRDSKDPQAMLTYNMYVRAI